MLTSRERVALLTAFQIAEYGDGVRVAQFVYHSAKLYQKNASRERVFEQVLVLLGEFERKKEINGP